jgi:hypothetical protein
MKFECLFPNKWKSKVNISIISLHIYKAMLLYRRVTFIMFIFNVLYESTWIDEYTHTEDKQILSYVNNEIQYLIFSDEFEINGRTFHDGDDPRWTAIHKDDYTNDALQYYNDKLVSTNNGYLNISTIVEDVHFHSVDSVTGKSTKLTKNYQSGMIQGWNKFCFTGGVVEVRAQLPGRADIAGLWPAMWLMGNLARATYVGSSDNIWPWSYDTCSRKLQTSQQISACNVMNHFDLHSMQGRGAPEIDILEAMAGREQLVNTPINRPYYSASLQVSPGIEHNRPITGNAPQHGDKWYSEGLEYGNDSSLNIFFYGVELEHSDVALNYQADALSANTNLQDTHFNSFHDYRVEWVPGERGHIHW